MNPKSKELPNEAEQAASEHVAEPTATESAKNVPDKAKENEVTSKGRDIYTPTTSRSGRVINKPNQVFALVRHVEIGVKK